jgi:hypothetical protein
MTYCPRCQHWHGKDYKVLLKKTDRVYNKQHEWQCPECGYCESRDTRKPSCIKEVKLAQKERELKVTKVKR